MPDKFGLTKNRRMIMAWYPEEALQLVLKNIQDHPEKGLATLHFQGELDFDQNGFIEDLLRNLPANVSVFYRLDFAIEEKLPEDLPWHLLNLFHRNHFPAFVEFLTSFRPDLRQNIIKQIETGKEPGRDWYRILFLQCTVAVAANSIPLFVFENVHLADKNDLSQTFAILKPLQDKQIRIVTTGHGYHAVYESEGKSQIFKMRKISPHQVETNICSRFGTSAFNARLITNHSYIKTAGNSLKIRCLLESVYAPLLDRAGDGFVDVKQLRRIRISGDWDSIFQWVYQVQNENEQRFLTFFSFLNEPVCEPDLKRIADFFAVSQAAISRWLSAGIVIARHFFSQTYFLINNTYLKEWLRQKETLQNLKEAFLHLHRLQKAGELQGTYAISHYLYELEENRAAIHQAKLEAKNFERKNLLVEAAEKLYFVVRLAYVEEAGVEDVNVILEHLAEIYTKMGANENAFEMYHKLRQNISNSGSADQNSAWLKISLKIAESLIAMDAFQEARYFIREIKAKDFCRGKCQARCLELLGDTESAISHKKYALHNYSAAFDLYQKTDSLWGISAIYPKLKSLLQNEKDEWGRIIRRTNRMVEKSGKREAFNALLWIDTIQLLFHENQHREALTYCHRLRKHLRKFYRPKCVVQLTFYYSEIYVLLGKPRLAICHLKELQHSIAISHSPYLQIQTLIQLGLVHKDQLLLGAGLHYFKQAETLCSRFNFSRVKHELLLQIGHLHILAHGLMDARRYLKMAHDRAAKNQETNIQILSALYLSYYEIYRNRTDKAGKWLKEVRGLIKISNNSIDFLNYYYYLSYWLLSIGENSKALVVARLLLKKSKDLSRYQAAAFYLMGKCFKQQNKFYRAQLNNEKCLKLSEKLKLPLLKYFALCEQVRISRLNGDSAQTLKLQPIANNFISEIADGMADEILKTHFLEASIHEDILGAGNKQRTA